MGDTTPTTRPAFAWGVSTHPGRVRDANEDSFVAEPMVLGIADGMGGHQAGEVASELAVDILRDRLGDGAANLDVVVAAVVEANAAIFQAAHTNAAQRGMGTTLTAIALLRAADDDVYGADADQLVLVNVGDSRAYVRRAGVLRRASIDHSYVQELVATGHITESEARTHPRRNIVTRALGIEPTVRIDTWTLRLVRGDRYVLCSDGLVDEVADDEIDEILERHDDPQAAADELVELANANGGRDNVTVIVVDVLVGANPPPAEPTPFEQPAGATLGNAAADDDDLPEQAMIVTDDEPPADTVPPANAPVFRPVIGPVKRRRITTGMVLFLFALAAIATLTVVFAVIAVNNDDNTPAPSTTVVTTTVPSTTVPSTTTTNPATTSPATTSAATTSPATTSPAPTTTVATPSSPAPAPSSSAAPG